MTIESKSISKNIPDYLIRETIDGIPFYYKGFREVLNKTKSKAEIMADSGLQGFIKSWLMRLLFQHLDLAKYHVFVGETVTHIDHKSNLALDLSVFEKAILTPDKITTKYIDVPPKLVVEIDVSVELESSDISTFDQFLLRKIRKLHKFGTEKIIWIFTKSKTVIITGPNNKWDVLEWDSDVELLEGITFNIAKHLAQSGIDLGENEENGGNSSDDLESSDE